jgi:hypothetical protein
MDEAMRMPPELDLLECLSAEDLSFSAALRQFSDDPFDADNIRRVRRVVAIYAKQGYVLIKRPGQDEGGGVMSWEVRGILADAATWAAIPDDAHRFLLSLTPAGRDAFVDDSQAFFDRLFG